MIFKTEESWFQVDNSGIGGSSHRRAPRVIHNVQPNNFMIDCHMKIKQVP
jgi:hypothetical protein